MALPSTAFRGAGELTTAKSDFLRQLFDKEDETRFSRMLQRRLAASPALQGHSAAPRPTRRTLHDAGRGTSRPKSARRTPQSGRSSIPRELYAQHVRDGPQLRHRRASQTPAGLIEPAVTVTPGHFLADDSRPMSSQRMITQRSLTSSAVPSSKRKKARHVEVPSLEAGPLAPSARRSSLRVTATPMAKEYAIGLTRDVFQRRADKHLTGHHRELRSELLEMVELRENLAVQLQRVNEQIASVSSRLKPSRVSRGGIDASHKSTHGAVAEKVGGTDAKLEHEWHKPGATRLVNSATTLQSLCATCGFSFGEHVAITQGTEQRGWAAAPPSRDGDQGHLGDRKSRLSRPRSASGLPLSARRERLCGLGGRSTNDNTDGARAHGDMHVGNRNKPLRHSEPASLADVHGIVRSGVDNYRRLYDVADGDIIALDREIYAKPSGAVCSSFVPGCLGPAPLFRAKERVREAEARPWQFMNAYNTSHSNAFALFGKERGWT